MGSPRTSGENIALVTRMGERCMVDIRRVEVYRVVKVERGRYGEQEKAPKPKEYITDSGNGRFVTLRRTVPRADHHNRIEMLTWTE